MCKEYAVMYLMLTFN